MCTRSKTSLQDGRDVGFYGVTQDFSVVSSKAGPCTVEAWVWVMGDDTILPQAGLESCPRLKEVMRTKRRDPACSSSPRSSTWIVPLRSTELPLPATPSPATRGSTPSPLGANYWHSKRFRGIAQLRLESFRRRRRELVKNAEKNLMNNRKTEHEMLFRYRRCALSDLDPRSSNRGTNRGAPRT